MLQRLDGQQKLFSQHVLDPCKKIQQLQAQQNQERDQLSNLSRDVQAYKTQLQGTEFISRLMSSFRPIDAAEADDGLQLCFSEDIQGSKMTIKVDIKVKNPGELDQKIEAATIKDTEQFPIAQKEFVQ